jgi:AraC-like DNA-binding protein
MHNIDFKPFVLSAVIFTALSALIIILFDLFDQEKKHPRLKLNLAFYFFSHLITNCSFLVYFYAPSLFIKINWLLMFGIVAIPVFLYAFIFKITSINPDEKFSKIHYFAPIILSVAMLILTFVTPIQEQLTTIKSDGNYRGDSLLFYLFSNKYIFRVIFNIIYVGLSFNRLSKHHKFIGNYSANETKSSLRWVSVLLFFIISLTIVPLYGLFVSRSGVATSYIAIFQATILIVQCNYLAFHAINRDYIIVEPNLTALNIKQQEHNSVILKTKEDTFLKKDTLNKEQFDCYIKLHKPYLEPNLKITDLAERLHVNRTYVSSFINNEYGNNFSSYINKLRMKEFELLRTNNKFEDISNSELAEKVGFGSYRSYTRFVALQKERMQDA